MTRVLVARLWFGIVSVLLCLALTPCPEATTGDAGEIRTRRQWICESCTNGALAWIEAEVEPGSGVTLDVTMPMKFRTSLSRGQYCVACPLPELAAGSRSGPSHTERWRGWIERFTTGADVVVVEGVLVLHLQTALDCLRVLDVLRFGESLQVGVPYSKDNFGQTVQRYGFSGRPQAECSISAWHEYVEREIGEYVLCRAEGRSYVPSCPERRVYCGRRSRSASPQDYVVMEVPALRGWHWVGADFFAAVDCTESACLEADVAAAARSWFAGHARGSRYDDLAVILDQEWIGNLSPPRPWGRGWRVRSTEDRDAFWGPGSRRLCALLSLGTHKRPEWFLVSEVSPSGSVLAVLVAPSASCMDLHIQTLCDGAEQCGERYHGPALPVEAHPTGNGALAVSVLQAAGCVEWCGNFIENSEGTPADSGLLRLGCLARAYLSGGTRQAVLALAESGHLRHSAPAERLDAMLIATRTLRDLCAKDPELLTGALGESRPQAAVALLGVLADGGAEVRPHLGVIRDLTTSENAAVATAAIRALFSHTRDEETVTPAIHRLLAASDAAVLRRGIYAAGCIRARSVATLSLIREKMTSDLPAVRRMAAAALIRLGVEADGAVSLVRELESDPNSLDFWLVEWCAESD